MEIFRGNYWKYTDHHGHSFGVSANSKCVFTLEMTITNENGPFVVESPIPGKFEYESAKEAMDVVKNHYAQFIAELEKETRAKWIPPMLYSKGVANEIASGLAVPYYDGLIVTLNKGIFRQADGAVVPMSTTITCYQQGCTYCRLDNTFGILYVTNSPHKTVQEILEFGTDEQRKCIKYNVLDSTNLKTIGARSNILVWDGARVTFTRGRLFKNKAEFQRLIAKYKKKHYNGIAVFKPNRRYEPGYKGYISDAVQTIRL